MRLARGTCSSDTNANPFPLHLQSTNYTFIQVNVISIVSSDSLLVITTETFTNPVI